MMYDASAASAATTSRPAVRLRALAANVHQSCGEEPVLLECGKTCARFQPVGWKSETYQTERDPRYNSDGSIP
jgi:hypothetical protein